MARSQRLKLKDVKAVYHLVQECREFDLDWELWGRHLLQGWIQLLDGNVATLGEALVRDDGQILALGSILHVGWRDAGAEALYQEYLQSNVSPLLNRLAALGLSSATRSLHARCRHRSDCFNELVVHVDIDDGILSLHTGPAISLMLSLHRLRGAPRFANRERRLSQLLREEIAPLVGTALAAAGEPGLAALSPRLRQTLTCLLEGGSEKEVAGQLGLSTATIHQYVGQLYRHYGVNGRAELLALFLRRSGLVPGCLAAKPQELPGRHSSRLAAMLK